MPRTLAGLLAVPSVPAVPISGLQTDSRLVKPGDLFLACPGIEHDARHFISQAVVAGAVAIVAEPPVDTVDYPAAVPVVELAGLREQIGPIASRFYGEPSRAMHLVGVTGTNGKTTVTQLIAQLLRREHSCGVIGTLGASLSDTPAPASHTTPDALALQTQLAQWRDARVRHAVMEVSSHALHQGRVNAVDFDTAVFTNLSHDHLDYHGTMRAYGEAKLRLFQMPGLRHAVVNIDDAFGLQLLTRLPTGLKVLTYSTLPGAQANVRMSGARLSSGGMRARLDTPWGGGEFTTALVGEFNLANLAAAAAAGLLAGMSVADVLTGIEGLRPVAGRMQPVRNQRDIDVIVDYAHTPDALEKALFALRDHVQGKLRVVFGCGGDRDRSKRAAMGCIACSLADSVYLTSDNPRGEDPETILDDIAAGCSGDYYLLPDRAEAIARAIGDSSAGDCVLIAGKGHEEYQLIEGRRLPFSDTEQAQKALRGGQS